MSVPAPKNKKDMYVLYERGAFGNMLKTWPTVADYLADTYTEPVVLRNKVPGGRWCAYGLTRVELVQKVEEFAQDGAPRNLFVVNELADDSELTIQGEVQRDQLGLSLRYSTEPLPMRKALSLPHEYANGLAAKIILEKLLDASDFEWLMELLDTYEDGVIEFSVWAKSVGNLARRMVVWEIRNY